MNTNMIKSVTLAAFGGVASCLFADTQAFYAFCEGGEDDSVSGKTILNAVDSSKYAGTPTLVSTATVTGDITYSSDAPAKYIFSGQGGVPVATNVQSLFFTGSLNRSKPSEAGGTINLAALASDMSSWDEYTVEFFYKFDETEIPGLADYFGTYSYNYAIQFNDGTKTGTPSITLPFSKTRLNFGIVGATTVGESAIYDGTYSGYKVPDTLADGKWHHVAVTHSKNQKLSRFIADYTSAHCSTSRGGATKGETADNETLSEEKPFILGNYVLRGKVACLRVSNRVLGTSELLYASNASTYFTDISDTVFLWSFSGTPGTAVSTVTNALAPVNFHAANPDLFYFNSGSIVSSLYTGNGESVKPSGKESSLTYSADLPHARKILVCDGTSRDQVVGTNTASYAQNPESLSGNPSYGLHLPSANFRHFAKGSFTIETFLKVDCESTQGSALGGNVTVFASQNNAYNFDWNFNFAMSTSPTGKCQGRFNWYACDDSGTYGSQGTAIATQVTYGTAPFDGKWHHVAMVYTDVAPYGVQFYLDYEPWFSTTTGGHLWPRTANAQNFCFGYGCNLWSGYLAFDEMRMMKKALSPSEFLHLNRPFSGMTVIVR